MSMEVSTKRNLGLDLLRMVSMLGVVELHVLGQQGVLASATPLSPDYMTAWLLETAAFCAVNCYALISGYVGIFGRFHYSSLALIWCQAAWYTLLIPIWSKLGVCARASGTMKSYLTHKRQGLVLWKEVWRTAFSAAS